LVGSSDSAGDGNDLDEDEEVTAVVGRPAPTQPTREEKAASRRPQLIVLSGESVGQAFHLDRPAIIGRGEVAQVRLHDDGVSRRHAMVVRVGGELCLEDLQSANGTRVNGEPITRHVLRNGDKIQLGEKTILRFTDDDSAEERSPQATYETAVRDALTRVYNRRHFVERLESEVAYSRRHRSPLSMLMIDIDHFKRINDGYGRPAGDYVLATLGQILLAAVRVEDIVARYGGDEFAILCRGTAPMSALQLADRLRRDIEAHGFAYRGKRIPVTLSVGIAMCADSPAAAQYLVAKAEGALHEAKQAGRNRAVLQHPIDAR
jgi:two-component system cell cycle response regulator